MSGIGDSEIPGAAIPAGGAAHPAEDIEDQAKDDVLDPDEDDVLDPDEDARRARWAAAGAGVLLTLAGLGASALRLTGSAPTLVPAAYAAGAAVCALAAALGVRGRTRRALWLLVVGLMVMALGDQFD